MADSKTGGILALAQKQIARTKTKVLQNLGKADRTTDDVFNEFVVKVDKQQEVATHLQKELKTYMNCLREMSVASKNLTAAIMETYETEWTKEETFTSQIQTFDLLWNDCLQNLQDSVAVPLNNYLQTFPALRTKIAKRGRKMVDYDNSRHNVESLQAAKKKDDVKIQKAQEEMKEAKRIYEELNNELHAELPEFNNSRVTFYAGLLSSMFGAELVFHSEIGKVNSTLSEICQELGREFERFTYQPRRPLSKSPSLNSGENGFTDETSAASPSVTAADSTGKDSTEPASKDGDPDTSQDKSASDSSTQDSSNKSGDGKLADESNDDSADKVEATYNTSPSNRPVISPPPNTLFTVQATHKYAGEDVDELTFDIGEIIYVIPYDNPEEQDDGWHMGIKASSGIQGVFPENFTQRI